MRQNEIGTQTLKISDAKGRLSSLVSKVSRGDTRILIEKSGVPVAALVSVADFKQLSRMDEEDREAWEIVEAMRAPFRDVPLEEIERETEKAIAEIRAEKRAAREAAARSA